MIVSSFELRNKLYKVFAFYYDYGTLLYRKA